MAQENPQPLNEAQIYLLKLFSRNPSKEDLENIQRLIAIYFAKKAEKLGKEIVKKKGITPEMIKATTNQSLRAMCR